MKKRKDAKTPSVRNSRVDEVLKFSDWQSVRLGDVCEIIMGQSPDGSSYNNSGEGEPLLNGPTEFGPAHPTAVQWTSAPTRLCQAGDILLCVRGATTGRKNMADKPYCIGRGLAAIRGREGITDTSFLWFVLDVVTAALLKLTSGSTFPNLPGDKLERIAITLPPLAEQRRIASRLRGQLAEVAQARAAIEAQLAAAQALPSAHLRAVFNGAAAKKWPRRRLGDVLTLRKEVVHPRNNPRGPAIFVGLEHTESHTGRRIGSLPVEMSELTGRKPRFYQGDIVYGYLRPYLNKVWLAEFDGLCSVDQYVYEVNQEEAHTEFIAWFMRSPVYLARAPVDRQPGQLPRIRTEEVAAVEINLPPLATQRETAERIQSEFVECTRLQNSLSDKLTALDQLPAALLREAFAGTSG